MMSKMHAAFSIQIYKYLLLKYNVKIKKKSLIYGSIKPDASTIFAKYPHYIDKSLDMLTARISMLIDATDTEKQIETYAFAKELGVATHYLADYFCRVHNDINGKKHSEGIRHIIYEQKMVSKIKKDEIELLAIEAIEKIDNNLKFIDTNSLSTLIAKRHTRYMKEAKKLYLHDNEKKRNIIDVSYALEVILTVCSYIINSILNQRRYYGRI